MEKGKQYCGTIIILPSANWNTHIKLIWWGFWGIRSIHGKCDGVLSLFLLLLFIERVVCAELWCWHPADNWIKLGQLSIFLASPFRSYTYSYSAQPITAVTRTHTPAINLSWNKSGQINSNRIWSAYINLSPVVNHSKLSSVLWISKLKYACVCVCACNAWVPQYKCSSTTVAFASMNNFSKLRTDLSGGFFFIQNCEWG